MYKEKLYFCYC